MERKFLLYLLYITLIEIREYSQETGNDRFFWLSDILHNIPFQLESEEDINNAYKSLIDNVKKLHIDQWLETRKSEFYARFPEYKTQ